jgi:uncharacterized protein (UPF0276 family)
MLRGVGLGWRPELAWLIACREDLAFVEIIAETFAGRPQLPAALAQLRQRGVAIVPHGISLSLGGAEPLDMTRVDRLARLAEQCGAPLVSEHLAFTRAGGLDSGHLLPVAHSRAMLDVVIANVRRAQAVLPVPLAIENIAALFAWPDAELDEADFLAELLDASGARLLLDVENLYANQQNLGTDPARFFDRLPLDKLAYVHLAGGFRDRAGLYHDTHAHAVPDEVFLLLGELCRRCPVAAVLLERDDRFPPDAAVHAELDVLCALIADELARAPRRVA